MAYSANDPFICMTHAALAVGPRIFYHESAADAATFAGVTSGVGNYVTDGLQKGLRIGDFVLHTDVTTAGGLSTMHRVLGVDRTLGNATYGRATFSKAPALTGTFADGVIV